MKPYKFRKAESNVSPKIVEYLQNGILIRFGITEKSRKNEDGTETTFYEYSEFWFDPKTQNIAEIVKSKGFSLILKYKKLLK